MYVLRCGDGSLYTGITNDVEKRLEMHRSGKGSKYVRARLPVEMVYCEECVGQKKITKSAVSGEDEVEEIPAKVVAAKREYEIKNWRREKKMKEFGLDDSK